MPLLKGTQGVVRIYRGSASVARVYRGSTLVFERAPQSAITVNANKVTTAEPNAATDNLAYTLTET
jgi:hypothetical protein